MLQNQARYYSRSRYRNAAHSMLGPYRTAVGVGLSTNQVFDLQRVQIRSTATDGEWDYGVDSLTRSRTSTRREADAMRSSYPKWDKLDLEYWV